MKIFDMLLANAMMGEGGGGGGGGSSDFSTVTVTIFNQTASSVVVEVPHIVEEYEDAEPRIIIGAANGIAIEVILYKGSAYGYTSADIGSVDGDVEKTQAAEFSVTGNGTITIS